MKLIKAILSCAVMLSSISFGAPADAVTNQQFEKWLAAPVHGGVNFGPVSLSNYEGDKTDSATARWWRKKKGILSSALVGFFTVAAALFLTFLILQCFQKLQQHRDLTSSMRQLAEGEGNNFCVDLDEDDKNENQIVLFNGDKNDDDDDEPDIFIVDVDHKGKGKGKGKRGRRRGRKCLDDQQPGWIRKFFAMLMSLMLLFAGIGGGIGIQKFALTDEAEVVTQALFNAENNPAIKDRIVGHSNFAEVVTQAFYDEDNQKIKNRILKHSNFAEVAKQKFYDEKDNKTREAIKKDTRFEDTGYCDKDYCAKAHQTKICQDATTSCQDTSTKYDKLFDTNDTAIAELFKDTRNFAKRVAEDAHYIKKVVEDAGFDKSVAKDLGVVNQLAKQAGTVKQLAKQSEVLNAVVNENSLSSLLKSKMEELNAALKAARNAGEKEIEYEKKDGGGTVKNKLEAIAPTVKNLPRTDVSVVTTPGKSVTVKFPTLKLPTTRTLNTIIWNAGKAKSDLNKKEEEEIKKTKNEEHEKNLKALKDNLEKILAHAKDFKRIFAAGYDLWHYHAEKDYAYDL